MDQNFIPMMREMEKFAADGKSLTIRAENKIAPTSPVTENQKFLQEKIEEAIPGALEVLQQIVKYSGFVFDNCVKIVATLNRFSHAGGLLLDRYNYIRKM